MFTTHYMQHPFIYPSPAFSVMSKNLQRSNCLLGVHLVFRKTELILFALYIL